VPSRGVFSHPVAIRWRDSDAFAHVNHAVFLTYLEEGRDRFLEQAFGSPPVYVVVRIEMDLLRELPLGQREATVRIMVTSVGRTSVILEESLEDAGGNTVARSRTTIVRWDNNQRKPRPVSPEERAVLQADMAGSAEEELGSIPLEHGADSDRVRTILSRARCGLGPSIDDRSRGC
jgi:acyl-CoA thioester hydrolase